MKGTLESPPASTPNHALSQKPFPETPACPNGVGGAGAAREDRQLLAFFREATCGCRDGPPAPARPGLDEWRERPQESLRERQEDAAFRGSLHAMS